MGPAQSLGEDHMEPGPKVVYSGPMDHTRGPFTEKRSHPREYRIPDRPKEVCKRALYRHNNDHRALCKVSVETDRWLHKCQKEDEVW